MLILQQSRRSSAELYLHPYQSTLSEGLLSWNTSKIMKENNFYPCGDFHIPSFSAESLPSLLVNHIEEIVQHSISMLQIALRKTKVFTFTFILI